MPASIHLVRAVHGPQVIEPDSVQRYLEDKFGDDLNVSRKAMQRLAKSMATKDLAERCFELHERFRPEIPEGVKGWGAKGILDLGVIERLATGRSMRQG